ncbi:MAG: VWA domain-containing protein [Lachnospiraceae bacterium]|nr:VWA domain-containing protein [Lachnospiraceae bacterium]
MMNNITELVFILDRSGSMGGLESDTIGGFNAMIHEQKEKDGECYVSTILFDNEITTIHDRIPLAKVPELTRKEYFVRGCTALIDAIGLTIDHISNVHKYIRPEDVPEHTLFVITTDGMENASSKYSSDEVKKMINQKKEKGWDFVFIGANIDAVETARHFGIGEDHAVDYMCDEIGTQTVYKSVSKLACNMRANMPYSASWNADIKADYKKRKR